MPETPFPIRNLYWIMPEWYRSYCDWTRPAPAAASGSPVKEA